MPISLVVLQLVLIIAALGVGGYLFISLKQDIARVEHRRKADAQEYSIKIAQLRSDVTELKKDLESLPAPAPPGPGAGINLNMRTQALRMARSGEGPEHIAAALRIPKREVDLLMKVQRLLTETAVTPTDSA